MNFLDMRTVVLSYTVNGVVCLGVILALWWRHRERFPGLRLVVLDFALQAAGVFLLAMRGVIPDFISMVVANSLVLGGAIFGYMGLSRIAGIKAAQIHNVALLVIQTSVQIYFSLVRPDLEARIFNTSVCLLAVYMQCAWVLTFRVAQGNRPHTRGVALVFWAYCTVSLVRIAGAFAGEYSSAGYMEQRGLEPFILLSWDVLLVLLTYNILLMTDRFLSGEIAAQQEKYSKAFRSSHSAMLLTRLADGRIAEVNDAFSGISGYGQAEAAGKTTVELNLWADEKDRALVVDELSVSGKAGGKEFRFRRKSGELLTGLFSADIIQIGVEKLVLSNITDITERKRAEEALKESEERYRTLVEEATEAIAVYDLQMERFIDFNRNAEILFGCSRGELMKEGVQKFYSQTQPDGRSVNESFHEHRERCSGGEPLIFERVVRRPDGTERYCEVRLVRLPSRDRKLIRTSYIDITDRKRMEQEKEKLQGQLLQSQKMEAVGRLAGGVAHDFNNLLTGITGHVQLALMDVEEGGTLHESLVEINKAAESAAGLTRQLLAFSRKQIAVPVVIDLGKVVRGMDKFLKRVLGEDVRLSIETPIAPSPVKIDPVQLEQVIVNLAVNSRLAMPEGGEITIRVSDEWVKEADKVAHPGVAAGNNVMISVTDTGCGMTEEVKGHVFEPFFTTRELGKGTGLGLSTVYGIVKQNGGAIEFDSEPGRGTTFRIYLPRVDGKSEDGGTRMYGERSAGGDETIVLVEDEAVVRDVAERILKKLGYTVRSFAGGAEALAALEKSADPPHMLVTDVVMPGMNGKMLAEKMACLRPGIKVLFTSGYTDNLLVSDDERNFIAKPYTPQGLAKKVREILDG